MASELIYLENDVQGHQPARTSILLTELSGKDQRGLIWGRRCRHYDDAATAALSYEAEDLEPLDSAAVISYTGASGGDLVKHSGLATGWTPVLGTNIGGSDFLTHVGTYRVWARVYGISTALRFVWDVGDLTLPVENDEVSIPTGSAGFYLLNLGEIRLDRVPTGDHRWQGQVQARSVDTGREVSIDKLWFLPVDEGYGLGRAPINPSSGLTSFIAHDEFDQTSPGDPLAGETLPAGGTWAGTGTGDFILGSGVVSRVVADSAGIQNGRFELAGTGVHTAVAWQLDVFLYGDGIAGLVTPNDVATQAALVRYTDTSNFVVAAAETTFASGPITTRLKLIKRKAGTTTTVRTLDLTGRVPQGWYSLLPYLDEDGRWFVWIWPQGGAVPAAPAISGYDADLATGGTLASGKVGMLDHYVKTGILINERTYDNAEGWVPVGDAVLFADQWAELRSDGMYRVDANGDALGPVSQVEGALPRLPPAGLEGRPVETIILTSEGDLDQLPDSGTGSTSARETYRPSYLFLPAS